MNIDEEIFNTNKLQSSDFRDYFQRMQLRMDEVSHSIEAGYGLPENISGIKAFISHELTFNAQAYLKEQTACISINASVLLSLRILFDRILSYEHVLPRLQTKDELDIVSYKTQFILNTNTPHDWSQLSIVLGREKFKASGILSDLCVTFIFLHEFGHLLCGHVEAVRQRFSEPALMEFNRKDSAAKNPDLRQYWEYQADSIAASLLAQYIGDLIANTASHQLWILTAADLQAHQHSDIAIHVTAMVLASLHVLFLYMAGCTFNNDQQSFHPPAQSRMMYLKDIIATEVGRRCSVDPESIVSTYYKEYFSAFISSLDELGLPAHHGFNEDYMDSADEVVERLLYSHDKYRNACREWSWLPVDEWGNP